MNSKLQIRDITKATGLDRETLRFYEQKGLLPKPARTEAGYREFDSDVIARVQFIKMAQEVGFSLREILELLNLGQSTKIKKSDLKKIAVERVALIDEKIKALKKMRKAMTDLASRVDTLSSNNNCAVLAQFKNLELQ